MALLCRYYCDVLYIAIRDEKSYDRLPNFTAADIVRTLGVGRNEYIDIMNEARGRKSALGALWKVRPPGVGYTGVQLQLTAAGRSGLTYARLRLSTWGSAHPPTPPCRC